MGIDSMWLILTFLYQARLKSKKDLLVIPVITMIHSFLLINVNTFGWLTNMIDIYIFQIWLESMLMIAKNT